MAKPVKAKSVKAELQLDVSMERRKSVNPKLTYGPLLQRTHNGEFEVGFNKYVVGYSNNFEGNLLSPWRAGMTSINCYQDNTYVGAIYFFETAENFCGGYISSNGIVVMEFPIEEFENILRILRKFNNLVLRFVENDDDGTPLAHRIGAVMTDQQKSIGS